MQGTLGAMSQKPGVGLRKVSVVSFLPSQAFRIQLFSCGEWVKNSSGLQSALQYPPGAGGTYTCVTAAAFSVMEPSHFLTVAIVTAYPPCIYRGRSRYYIWGKEEEEAS